MTTYNGDKHHLPHVFIADERNGMDGSFGLLMNFQIKLNVDR
jgi:hypothetical protein